MGSLCASQEDPPFHLGRRLSYNGALCTVRYHGALPGTKGVWLGVEWDDVARGKHDGTYQGRTYFHCLSSAPSAASFIRPSRIRDPPRAFLEALRFKYVAEDIGSSTTTISKALLRRSLPNGNVIEISGKVVEEVGFERIRQQQAVLEKLRIVLLDGLCVPGIALERIDPATASIAQGVISQTCPELVELDLGWNLFETWTALAEICLSLKKLQVLRASGLRLRQFDLPPELEEKQPFRHVVELHFNENLLQPEQIISLVASPNLDIARFPALKILSLSQNCLSHLRALSQHPVDRNLPSVTTFTLDNNLFTSLAFLPDVLSAFPDLRALSLQCNLISSIGLPSDSGAGEETFSFPQLESLNLSHNIIQHYSFIDGLPRLFPRLRSLRISHNPVFTSGYSTQLPPDDETLNQAAILSSTSSAPPARASVVSRSSGSDAAYSLTLARIPTLTTLNHSTITARDREEGEIYYTSLAEREISASLSDVAPDAQNQKAQFEELKTRYPRYEELCRKYERDSVFDTPLWKTEQAAHQASSGTSYPPGSLGVRLLKAHFRISPHPGTSVLLTTVDRLIPRTISVYTLKALLARTFSLPALQFRLVYESAELDPVRDSTYQTSSWDTWGDWDLDHPPLEDRAGLEKEGKKWKRREVEIKDGTREWGFYVEDGVGEVTVRVEPFK